MPGPPQSRIGDKSMVPADSHGCPACPHPCVGPAVAGSPDVFVNSRNALRVGDPGIHAACCGPNTWKAKKGSKSVFINGKAAHRLGDEDKHCGGKGVMIEGSPDVFVGGPPNISVGVSFDVGGVTVGLEAGTYGNVSASVGTDNATAEVSRGEDGKVTAKGTVKQGDFAASAEADSEGGSKFEAGVSSKDGKDTSHLKFSAEKKAGSDDVQFGVSAKSGDQQVDLGANTDGTFSAKGKTANAEVGASHNVNTGKTSAEASVEVGEFSGGVSGDSDGAFKADAKLSGGEGDNANSVGVGVEKKAGSDDVEFSGSVASGDQAVAGSVNTDGSFSGKAESDGVAVEVAHDAETGDTDATFERTPTGGDGDE